MTSVGDVDHRHGSAAIDKCRACARTQNIQSTVIDEKVLKIGRGCDLDRIARCSQSDGTADGLAGCDGRCAVVAVPAVHPIYIPCGGAKSRWGEDKKQSNDQGCCMYGSHDAPPEAEIGGHPSLPITCNTRKKGLTGDQ